MPAFDADTLAYPDNLLEYLDGIEFPAHKKDLLRFARERDAPEDALADLNRLPDRRFANWDEVSDGLGAPR